MLSSPLFGRPSKILDKMLQSSSGLTDLAPKLSRNLCQRFIANEDAPPDIYEPGSERAGSGSLVLSFASGLWNILTFGYRYIYCTYLRLSKVAFLARDLAKALNMLFQIPYPKFSTFSTFYKITTKSQVDIKSNVTLSRSLFTCNRM